MDALTAVLAVTRVEGGILANVTAHAPWGFGAPAVPGAAFHAVSAGTCWLRVPDQPARLLSPGDVVLFPTGARHELASDPGSAAQPYKDMLAAHPPTARGEIQLPGDGPCTRFICAGYTYDRELTHPLMSLLPPVLTLSAADTGPDTAVQATLRLLTHELHNAGPGSGAVVDRLIDILFVHVVRAWLTVTDVSGDRNWLNALHDPAIGHVLTAIHAEPERHWTLDTLALHAGLSRATLTRRFARLVGDSPLNYLTLWRLNLAARRLRNTTDPVDAIARSVGYSSPFAFSRAFSRHHGRPPSRYRTPAE